MYVNSPERSGAVAHDKSRNTCGLAYNVDKTCEMRNAEVSGSKPDWGIYILLF
jgi:hypothetical protein